jgi:hypothetical protein
MRMRILCVRTVACPTHLDPVHFVVLVVVLCQVVHPKHQVWGWGLGVWGLRGGPGCGQRVASGVGLAGTKPDRNGVLWL